MSAQTKHRLSKIAAGICAVCTLPAEEGKTSCAKHLSAKAAYDAKRRERFRKSGKCTSCGSPSLEGKAICQKHLDAMTVTREKYQRDQVSRAERGLCIYCEQPPAGIALRCFEHHIRTFAYRYVGGAKNWRILADLFHSQGGKCFYTGIPITMGLDASVDHKLPVGRYPELKDDHSNLVWCHVAVNTIKNKLTNEEFGWMCHRVAEHLPDFDIPANRMTEIMDNAFSHRSDGQGPKQWGAKA